MSQSKRVRLRDILTQTPNGSLSLRINKYHGQETTWCCLPCAVARFQFIHSCNFWNNFLVEFFRLWIMPLSILNTLSSDSPTDLILSHAEPVYRNFWIIWVTAVTMWSPETVTGIVIEHLTRIIHHTETHVPL